MRILPVTSYKANNSKNNNNKNVNFFRMLSERVKPLEPAELPVFLRIKTKLQI